MKIPSFDRKISLSLVLKTFLIIMLLSAVYVFAVALPSSKTERALVRTKQIISDLHANLLENRMTLVEYGQLSLSDPVFREKKTALIRRSEETRTNNLELLENMNSLPTISGNENLEKVQNEELPKAFEVLKKRHLETLNAELKLIELLNKLDVLFSYTYAYDTAQDLIIPFNAGQKDATVSKARVAKETLLTTKSSLQGIEDLLYDKSSKQHEDVLQSLDNATESLGAFQNSTDAENLESIENSITNLKESAFVLEQSIIRSTQSISLLTDQKDILENYEYWIKRIQSQQYNLNLGK